MNKESKTEKPLFAPSTGVAGDHIRSEISKQPKMSPGVAAHVARNLDVLLEELKDKGIAMHTICRAASLGNPDNRDSKALYKYRNPPGSKQRDYISQARRYVALAEAIADIKSHPYSGTSSAILRRVFAGTPYSPPPSDSGDASIALKVILDEVTIWIARHVNLVQAYERALKLSNRVNKNLSAPRQFEFLSAHPHVSLWGNANTPLYVELGFRDDAIKDNKSHVLEVRDEKGGLYNLCWRQHISLFIGIDEQKVPCPYLAIEEGYLVASQQDRSTSLRAGQDSPGFRISTVHDKGANFGKGSAKFAGLPDLTDIDEGNETSNLDEDNEATEFGELVFTSNDNQFYLPSETVARTVDLDSLTQRLQTGGTRIHFSFEPHSPVSAEFLLTNHELGLFLEQIEQGYACQEIEVVPATADTLEKLEVLLSEPQGYFAPAGEWSDISFADSILYGSGTLSKLIRWFTDGGLFLTLNSVEKEFLGDNVLDSQMTPPGGWISVSSFIEGLDSYRWSAADILWLRCSMFVKMIESQFIDASKHQKDNYDALVRKLKEESELEGE